jgi:hypothetical protein
VRSAQATVPRIENAPSGSPSSATHPDPNQQVAPGEKADQV